MRSCLHRVSNTASSLREPTAAVVALSIRYAYYVLAGCIVSAKTCRLIGNQSILGTIVCIAHENTTTALGYGDS